MNYYPPQWGMPPPPWCYPPQQMQPPIPMSNSAKDFRQWMKAMEEYKKLHHKEEKKEEKAKERSFSPVEVFLILVASSPAIALLYKFLVIPALLK